MSDVTVILKNGKRFRYRHAKGPRVFREVRTKRGREVRCITVQYRNGWKRRFRVDEVYDLRIQKHLWEDE